MGTADQRNGATPEGNADAAALVGGVVHERYRLDALLGVGGTAAVYRATRLATGDTVALKLLDAGLLSDAVAVERFLREATATAQVVHPNVVTVVEAGVDGKRPYLVTELLEGENLAERIARAPAALELREVAALMIPLLDGLAAAHHAGIVHRDVKPENVILHTGGGGEKLTPKLVDFGLSKLLRPPRSASATLTAPGVSFGTPHYVSPEQALNPRGVDARTDVWAVGVMLYRLLCGKVPFDGKSPGEVLGEVFHTTPLSPSSFGVPITVSAVITRCLEKESARRFADAGEVSSALCVAVGIPTSTGRRRLGSLPSLRVPVPSEPLPTVRPPAMPMPALWPFGTGEKKK